MTNSVQTRGERLIESAVQDGLIASEDGERMRAELAARGGRYAAATDLLRQRGLAREVVNALGARVPEDVPPPARDPAGGAATPTRGTPSARIAAATRHSPARSVPPSRSVESKLSSSGVLGGLLICALAIVWFVGGLMAGYVFFYPPVMLVLGLVSIVRGLFDATR